MRTVGEVGGSAAELASRGKNIPEEFSEADDGERGVQGTVVGCWLSALGFWLQVLGNHHIRLLRIPTTNNQQPITIFSAPVVTSRPAVVCACRDRRSDTRASNP